MFNLINHSFASYRLHDTTERLQGRLRKGDGGAAYDRADQAVLFFSSVPEVFALATTVVVTPLRK